MIEGSKNMQGYVPAVRASLSAGIRFRDWLFSEPVSLTRFMPPHSKGLFAILLPDPTWAPRPFQPLYFGDLAEQLNPEAYVRCLRAAAGKPLYITACALPYPAERAREALVGWYAPLCNAEDSHPMAARIEALEKKNSEQEAMLKVMLAALGRFLEPPPEPRPRTYGFQPGPPPV